MTFKYNDITKMKTNPSKVTNVILYVLTHAEQCNATLTTEEILQILFGADDAHLDAYARPITFDNYKAYPHGPVGFVAKEVLKSQKDWVIDGNNIVTRSASSVPDTRKLSQSDQEQIQAAYDFVKALGIDQACEKQRGHTAWEIADHYRGENENPDMDWYNFPMAADRMNRTLSSSYYIE